MNSSTVLLLILVNLSALCSHAQIVGNEFKRDRGGEYRGDGGNKPNKGATGGTQGTNSGKSKKEYAIGFISGSKCQLFINNKIYGVMEANQLKTVRLSPGAHKLKAIGQNEKAVFTKNFTAAANTDIIRIVLNPADAATPPIAKKEPASSNVVNNPTATAFKRDTPAIAIAATGASITTADSGKASVAPPSLSVKKDIPGQVVDIRSSKPEPALSAVEDKELKRLGVLVSTIRENMIPVKGGRYESRMDSRAPARTVTVGSFQISKYEVTQEQWETVMVSNPSSHKGCGRCPVENVSWQEVAQFIEKLNSLGKEQFRLPTEAEWQFIAQMDGRDKIKRMGGPEQFLEKTTWTVHNAGKKPHPVGTKEPHASGVYDLFGNVSEWCSDWFGAAYESSAQTLNNPAGPAQGNEKVIRGGSYEKIMESQKDKLKPEQKSKSVGFRLVSELH